MAEIVRIRTARNEGSKFRCRRDHRWRGGSRTNCAYWSLAVLAFEADVKTPGAGQRIEP